ncbi:MAG: reverse transcriptase domain-containing protein, partial [Roseibacillus sp.]|nr:reverse transcriptase domain-containing protein [Roseibacillus sp.]
DGSLVSVAERRLRRLLRELLHLHREDERLNQHCLVAKAESNLAWAKQHWEDLAGLTIWDLRTIKYVKQLADRIDQVDGAKRREHHQERMSTDLAAAQRWVNLVPPKDEWEEGEEIHPQARAEQLAKKWTKWWEADPAPPEALAEVLDCVPACGEVETPVVGPEALMRIVREGQAKAAGADGWSPGKLALLPLGFWRAVSDIWAVILQGGPLPAGWRAIRCVGIPKDSGGLRPLSISSIFWRCGSTALLSQLSTWIDQWAPPELAGGLKGRSADAIHEALEADIEAMWERKLELAGSKLDVEKFFDSCSLEQALAILQKVGMPKQILDVLRDFYRDQQRYFEVNGCCCATPVNVRRSLLQGCP